VAELDETPDLRGDDAGLAAAGSREDEGGSLDGLDRVELPLVERRRSVLAHL